MNTILTTFLLCISITISICATERPNIIVIMSDDMGISDIGCYGSEIDTPRLNQLADNGLRFTQFYNTARCCPTRASLLSGLYPHQAGVGWMMVDRGHDGYRGELNRECLNHRGSSLKRQVMGPTWLENGMSLSTSLLMARKITGQCKGDLTVFTEQFMEQDHFGIQTH